MQTQKTFFLHAAHLVLVCTLITLSVLGCKPEAETDKQVITVWAHSGQEGERKVLMDQVQRFNEEFPDVHVKLTLLPEGSYNSQLQSAALSHDLPDVIEFDGPFLYGYVWQNQLQPLDDLLPAAVQADLLPSIIKQGTMHDHLFAVGMFDSGLGMYGNKALLEAAGIRIPASVDDAWTAEEFNQVLKKLAAQDQDGAVLDLKANYRGEWFTYAFSPIIQSAGGDLIDRRDYLHAEPVLAGKEAVRAMTTLQDWFQQGYVDPNLDDAAFVEERVALSWVGHWEYPRYAEKLGDKLVLLPLPDFGQGSKTGQGSWQWGINADARNAEAAARFLASLLRPESILAMTEVNGAVPATKTAIARSPLYKEGGPLRLFVDQLRQSSVERPRTPAYQVITSVFQQAFDEIRNGADVQKALHQAAAAIEQDIADSEGYRSVPRH
ncbi:MAG: sugar ABC transporter substrate-binding protein [Candidatus Electrothrix scaldis]|nr:MAG: sugar ABC transporter substrate-binding protein [Candidatus Electrothrix sp. GW3-3]